MAKELNVEDALARAQQLVGNRMDSIKALADTRASVDLAHANRAERIAEVERETAEAISEADRADQRAYQAALRAGWSADELKKIGFEEAGKKGTQRKRAARKPAAAAPESAPAAQTYTPSV